MMPLAEQDADCINYWVQREQQWFIGQLELLRNRAVRLNDTRTAYIINDLLARVRMRTQGKDPAQPEQPTKKLKSRKK